jgi:Raf kinase inhibitor-like YbhB/YbcL family protein
MAQANGDGLELSSAAFADGATIPRRYTRDGDEVSPPLTWGRAPEGTESYALVVEDPDAPSGLFTHWTLWNLKPTEARLPEDVPHVAEASGYAQGENGFGGTGWGGPSPPPGKPHRYVFRLFALDAKLELEGGAPREALDRALDGHVLADTRHAGMYGR